MSENILVVEYEPRYIERARVAFSGGPFTFSLARDGEEALRAIDEAQPSLIVLSSVVPKISTTELIRMFRARKALQTTPILLTVSGYNGKSPRLDAQRVGASDILPKPYTEQELLGRAQEILGIASPDPAASPPAIVPPTEPQQEKPRKTTMAKPTDDVDKMLADTLAGMMPRKKTEVSTPTPPRPAPAPPQAAAPPPAAAPPATAAPSAPASNLNDLDKRFSDTLSGLEKNARRTTSGGTVPRPQPPAPAPVPPSAAPPRMDPPLAAVAPDRIPAAQPVMAAAPDLRVEEEEPVDGIRFGQYVLIEKIATGGMAEVWKARMKGVEGFQKIVAIKKILPHLSDNQDFIGMFIDEAKLAAQLNHNNIIHIYDLGKIQSSYYIAMEYIDGYDLKNILRRAQEHDNPMSVDLALFVASKIASALDYAHRKRDFEDREMGLVHRDVSPQNVLISQEGDIKLCDFGIAKAASKASHTQAGALKGKLQYMSPEQAWGRHVDRRSDVFALATVMFEMLTARKLFTGDNEMSILEQVREATVQAPSHFNDEVTPQIDAVVLKALQKEPENRYQTAGELAREIDAILYTFRPTPTSADLAIFMHRLSAPLPVAAPAPPPEPVVDVPPQPAILRTPPVVVTPKAPPPVAVVAPPPPVAARVEEPLQAAFPEEPRAKSKAGLIAAAAAVLLIGGGAAFFFTRSGSAPDPVQPARGVVPAAATGQPALTASAPAAVDTATTSTQASTTALDPSLVDQEVQKRLAAERARLEAQARASQEPAATPAQRAPAAVPQVAQQAPTPAVVPPPVESRPAPAAEQPAAVPAPAQAEPQRAAATPQPVVQRAREGDLVPAGTEGLVSPRLVKRGTVAYPPLARSQRVEGTVVTSVLVSETGTVLEVRVLRGINRPVGLNEAAQQTMRRSNFTPATKDGVRVRSWVTVPVEFKL